MPYFNWRILVFRFFFLYVFFKILNIIFNFWFGVRSFTTKYFDLIQPDNRYVTSKGLFDE